MTGSVAVLILTAHLRTVPELPDPARTNCAGRSRLAETATAPSRLAIAEIWHLRPPRGVSAQAANAACHHRP